MADDVEIVPNLSAMADRIERGGREAGLDSAPEDRLIDVRAKLYPAQLRAIVSALRAASGPPPSGAPAAEDEEAEWRPFDPAPEEPRV